MRRQGQQQPHHVRRGRALYPVTIGHADVTGGRNARAESWRARRMGTAGVIRHLPAGPEAGRPGLSSPPPRPGREAGDARQR